MGTLRAMEAATIMTEMAGREQAMSYHLTANHFPPVPTTMLPVCIKAVENWEDSDMMLDLPEGIEYQGQTQAPVWAIIEGHHLEVFVEAWGEEE
jgi:hypothetical protein